MRKSYLFLLTAAILFSACGGDDVVDEQEREPIITPTPEPEVVKDHVSDLTGVWQSITDDGVYFLAISDKGEVTYCLNRITLGKGTAKFLKDTLKISNDFTDETDIMFVTNRVGDTIDISGKVNYHAAKDCVVVHACSTRT
jgi:hypothetical protein